MYARGPELWFTDVAFISHGYRYVYQCDKKIFKYTWK
jgi:hypothetical protein